MLHSYLKLTISIKFIPIIVIIILKRLFLIIA